MRVDGFSYSLLKIKSHLFTGIRGVRMFKYFNIRTKV